MISVEMEKMEVSVSNTPARMPHDSIPRRVFEAAYLHRMINSSFLTYVLPCSSITIHAQILFISRHCKIYEKDTFTADSVRCACQESSHQRHGDMDLPNRRVTTENPETPIKDLGTG